MEKDLVYLVWTDVNTGNKYKVAELYKQENTFYFKYILDNVKEAQKVGFKLLVAFPQINALYDNPKLFANFAARLPEPTRPEIKEILATYDMTEYDDFELLKRSGAKLPTDDYEFVKQITMIKITMKIKRIMAEFGQSNGRVLLLTAQR